MYLGSNLDAGAMRVIVQNSVIEYCHIYDTLPAATGFGAAIQLKPGSNRNIVRFNVFRKNLIGVFMYDDFDQGSSVWGAY
jgi:nitrous oxidase accessory protein NosD